jgi:hypothetical protein
MQKKQLILLLIIGLFVISGFIIFEKSKNDINSMKVYSTDYYTIEYPADWKIEQEEEGFKQVRFIPPYTDCRICGLQALALKIPISTEKYTKTILEGGPLEKTILMSEPAILHILSAHKLIYTAKDGGLTKKWYRIYGDSDGVLYEVAFIFEEKEFKQYESEVDKMIKSFIIK